MAAQPNPKTTSRSNSSFPLQTTATYDQDALLAGAPLLPAVKHSLSFETDSTNATTTSREQLESIRRPSFSFDQSPNQRTRYRQLLTDWWLWELVTACLSVALMVSITILLYLYNGRPLAHWRSHVGFNALVSILATFAKATLLVSISTGLAQMKWNTFINRQRVLNDFNVYDSASRGVVGSIQLLWQTRARSLASIGAIITVLSIGTSAFFQQVISIQIGQTFVSDPGTTLPYAQKYSQAAPDPSDNPALASPIPSMVLAVLNGWTGDDQQLQHQMSFTCTSGNCTWPTFITLGICSRCADISALLNSTFKPPLSSAPDGSGSLQYALPNGLSIENLVGNTTSDDVTTMVSDVQYQRSKTLSSQDLTLLLFAITSLRADSSFPKMQTDWKHTLVEAQECALYFCLQEIDSRVSSGILSEDIKTTWSTIRPNSWQQLGETYADPTRGNATNITSCPQSSDSLWDQNSNADMSCRRSDLQLSVTDQLHTVPASFQETAFNISQGAINALGSTMSSILFGSSLNVSSVKRGIVRLPVSSRSSTEIYQPPFMQVLYGANQSSGVLENSVRSMTNGMRMYADNHTSVTGTLIRTEPYIIIQWVWLVFPATLTVSGCFFFMLVIRQTARCKARIWKTSILPVLVHGLNESALENVGCGSVREMEKKAQGVEVQLQDENGRVKLVMQGL